MKWEPGDPKIAAVFSERRGTSIRRERGRVSPLLGSPTSQVPLSLLQHWGCGDARAPPPGGRAV